MNIPAKAYFLEPERNPALPCVQVRPCIVTGLLPNATPPMAIIRIPSLTAAGWVSRTANFSDLASTLDKAIARVTEKIRALPEMPDALVADLQQPAADQKSASHEKAGAAAGALSSP